MFESSEGAVNIDARVSCDRECVKMCYKKRMNKSDVERVRRHGTCAWRNLVTWNVRFDLQYFIWESKRLSTVTHAFLGSESAFLVTGSAFLVT
jgi:hypothetical protein